jgi:hypothetical protein
MLAVALALALTGAVVAGCQSSGDPGRTPIGQTSTAEVSASPSGDTGVSTALMTETRSPKAVLPSKAGYIWVYQADSSFTGSTAYQFNSAGGAITVGYQGGGRYRVTFAGLGDSGGAAHAQSYGPGGGYCTIETSEAVGPDQVVDVACFDPSGAPADSMFVANFAAGSQDATRFSYLRADQPSRAEAYRPAATHSYDSVAAGELTVRRTDLGRYEAHLPASAVLPTQPHTFQVTAYGSASQCKLTGFHPTTRKANVACRTATGTYTDTRFTLSFAADGSFLGRSDRRHAEYAADSAGVSSPSVGVYVIRATGLGQAKGQVVAQATGSNASYCHVVGWTAVGADLDARVACFDPGGIPASATFTLGITW